MLNIHPNAYKFTVVDSDYADSAVKVLLRIPSVEAVESIYHNSHEGTYSFLVLLKNGKTQPASDLEVILRSVGFNRSDFVEILPLFLEDYKGIKIDTKNSVVVYDNKFIPCQVIQTITEANTMMKKVKEIDTKIN